MTKKALRVHLEADVGGHRLWIKDDDPWHLLLRLHREEHKREGDNIQHYHD